jgi:hypothetical protein
MSKTGKKDGVKVGDKTFKSGLIHKTEDDKTFQGFDDKITQEVNDLEHGTSLYDDGTRNTHIDTKDDQRTDVVYKRDPAPGPEQTREREDANAALQEAIRRALKDSPPSYLQLNHLVFEIPPEQINIQHDIKNVAMGVLRSSSTQKVRTGHGFVQVSFPLTFVSRSAVNTELVELLYMLRKSPFCWVHNEYLRKVLLPENVKDPMMLTLQSITVQSVPNLPTTFQAVLQMLWFNYKPYAKTIQYRKFYNLDERMQPIAFGPEFNLPELERVYEDVMGNFGAPAGMSIKSSVEKFREHLDAIRAEPDPEKQKRLYDYLQETANNPQLSLPWFEFIRGAESNHLTANEFGPNLAPDRAFRMAWKEWGSPGKSPVDKTWKLEDENYQIYSKVRYFNSNSEFVPIHVSIQYAHRIASLPLLSHQLPTHQYLGPTDREVTVTFHATKAGKVMLEKFQKEIELFEQNVIDYRALAHNAWMEIKTPLVKAAGFPKGRYGHRVVPEHINIETVPGNPANSVVRVTFSEFNPTVFQEDGSPLDKEDKVITGFIQAVFNRLSGGNPKNIIYAVTNVGETGGGGGWGKDVEVEKNKIILNPFREIDLRNNPWIELKLSLTRQQAEIKGMAGLWDCADEILTTTNRAEGDAVAFAYATDEEVYGLKSLAELSLFWGGNMLDQEKVGIQATQLKGNIKSVALKHLTGQVGRAFPTLAIEHAQVNLDLNSCYPDMELPPHPVTGRVIDTEPDFYLVDQELLAEADSKAETFARHDIMPAIKKIVMSNAQLDVDLDKEPVDISEKESEVYAQQGIVNMDGMPDIDYASGDLRPQNVDVIDRFTSVIDEDKVFDAGLASIRRDTRLGMKKAFPTFRLYFIKESRDQITYSSFYEAQGGFAVKDLSVVRDRNTPADMLMINMVDLAGFIETSVIDDIRDEDFRAEQTRYVADNELFEKHEQTIVNQLQIANSKYGTNIKFETIQEIIAQVSADPPPGGHGPMGVTNNHAELADGKTYSSSTLQDPVTNIRIGADVVCGYASQLARYKDETRFEEIVASIYRFPKREDEIVTAVASNYAKNGLITFEWAQPIRSTELNEYVEEFRPQGSSESFVRRQQYDEDIKKAEEELEFVKKERKRFERLQGIAPTPLPDPIKAGELHKLDEKKTKVEQRILTLKRDRESTAVRTPVTEGIIFKEGTDVVLKMGYSNNPENLEIVFIGEVTEVAEGPGVIQLVAQSFATELMQDIKGVPEKDAILKGDVDAAQVSNWILSYPEVRHFGRWEDSWEIREDERNIRGVWYKTWNWTNNPSDDNVYLGGEYVGEYTLNGRTLWQGLQDLCFLFPGFVMGVRPYRDLDANGRRRWRNTLFIGKPDTEFLWWVPDDWSTLLSEAEELDRDTYTRSGLDVGAEVQLDINLQEIQKDLDNLNARKKFLETVRRERFRRYHFLSSYHNMIDNGIILTKRGIYNGVRLNSLRRKKGLLGGEKDEYEDIVRRQLDGMDEENINWLYVENDNAWGHRAQRMATSILLWKLRDIYDGEITILGDASIRPYDVCFINDIYNDFHGPIEVGRVVHTFSEETGFITQIKPDLFTSIGEIAQRTAMGALGAYSYRWLMNRMGISWYDDANSELSQAYRTANEAVRGVTTTGGILTIAALTALYPLFMGPILLGGYFLGNYIKNHATIRVVPLIHKGYPFVTGLEGFHAPASSNALLNQFRLLLKGISEGVDAVSDLYLHLRTKRGRRAVFRRMFGL